MRLRRLALVVACGVAAPAAPAVAQNNPRLAAIVRLAQDGLADSARAELARVLAGLAPTDSLYAEALYTSGLVAGTDEERRLALRKVMVEHSRSEWADDAILLLAQLEYANGNPGGTVTQIGRLLDDYPLSPLRAMAAFWGARAAGDLRQGDLGCRWADLGLAVPDSDVELRNQLEYQKQRCQALVAMAADSAARAAPVPSQPAPAPPPPAPAPRSTGFFVQIAALDARGPADQAAASLREMNYAAVIVEEGGFFKVRAGPFPNRADAQTALSRIRARFGGRPFVVTVR